jgi:hypothetical protein
VLRTEFKWNDGITVPYPPLFDDIRRNHGFVDIRGRPDLAEKIPEGSQSPALRALLMRFAEAESPLFSLGCDLGASEQLENPPSTRCTAGGYIQFMCAAYAKRVPLHYQRFAEASARALDTHVGTHEWLVIFALTPVHFKLDDFSNMTGSLWIWFHAGSPTPEEALASREVLISKLQVTLFDERLTSRLNGKRRPAGPAGPPVNL